MGVKWEYEDEGREGKGWMSVRMRVWRHVEGKGGWGEGEGEMGV